MKYRKLPVEVEAYQVFEDTDMMEFPLWQKKEINVDNVIISKVQSLGSSIGYVRTLEGPLFFNDGDYIIQGVDGEVYACMPGTFAKTYEKTLEFQGCSYLEFDTPLSAWDFFNQLRKYDEEHLKSMVSVNGGAKYLTTDPERQYLSIT